MAHMHQQVLPENGRRNSAVYMWPLLTLGSLICFATLTLTAQKLRQSNYMSLTRSSKKRGTTTQDICTYTLFYLNEFVYMYIKCR